MRITYSFVLVFSIGIIGALVSAVMIAGASPAEVKGDLNCDGSVNPVDSLLLLRHDAGLSVNLPPGCDAIGSTAAGAARGLSAVNPKGDMNCNGSVNPVDSLLLLRHDAGLNVNLPPGCDAIGSTAATATPEQTLSPTPTPGQPTATQTPASTPTGTSTSTVAAATQTPATQPPLTPTSTQTSAPTATATATPTATATATAAATVTATPTPAGVVLTPNCWIAVLSNSMVNGFISSEESCGAFGYQMYICDLTLGSYRCVINPTIPQGFPPSHYWDCTGSSTLMNCYNEPFTKLYTCTLAGSTVSCASAQVSNWACSVSDPIMECTSSQFFPWTPTPFTCTRTGSYYECLFG